MTRAHVAVKPAVRSRRHDRTGRKGTVLVLAAVLLVVLLGLVALAVDTGYMLNVETELKRTADAGALAGVGVLVNGAGEATQTCYDFIAANRVAGKEVEPKDVGIETGTWDPETRVFTLGGDPPSAIRVTVNRKNEGLFFARFLGHDGFSADAQSIATFRPRDIMLVLDYSASMNDDSELRNINSVGKSAVEANLKQIYNELGAPKFGKMKFKPTYISTSSKSKIKSKLGLKGVSYPYPSGSWDDYINYVKSSSYVKKAGYRKKYGYLTLMNYLLERRPKHSETPDLWRTSEQPITAVKDAVQLFLAYLQEVETNDRIGLSVYTSADDTALLEKGLTMDFQSVEDISRQRQAGHYDTMTNISAGMRVAREEIEKNARVGSLKLMVLMTDGKANLPGSSYSASQAALDEAHAAADAKIPIVTISLGSGADTNLMQQIADLTGGVHFNIPGGQSVAEYEEDLKNVFRSIAEDRPLMLVQ